MTTAPKPKPKPPEYESKLGPIPLDNFGNDMPFREATGPGADYAEKLIEDAKAQIAAADKAKPTK